MTFFFIKFRVLKFIQGHTSQASPPTPYMHILYLLSFPLASPPDLTSGDQNILKSKSTPILKDPIMPLK